MKYLLSIVLLFLLVNTQKRIINNTDFDYEFYITNEEVKHPKQGKLYYWYKSGAIHSSRSDIGGSVLHDSYTKYYKSSQLAEKGSFKLGLKDGIWKSWNEQGELQVVETWKKGFKHGIFKQYDSVGKMIVKGHYQNHKQHGTWIDYVKKDTLYYKDGNKIIPKATNKDQDGKEKESFFKRLFKKKEKDPIKEQEKKAKKEQEKKERKAKREKKKKERKEKKNGVTKT